MDKLPTEPIQPVPKASLPALFFTGAFISSFGIIFLATFILPLVVVLDTVLTVVVVGLIWTLLTVGFVVYGYAASKKVSYKFDDDRVIEEKGLFGTSMTSVQYEDLTDVHYNQSFIQNYFGVGTVKLNTAGSDDKVVSISNVKKAESLYDLLRKKTQ